MTIGARAPKQDRSRKTHEQILNATISCLQEFGYHNVSTIKVAKQAGLSQGAVFQRFPSKQILIVSAVSHYFEKLKSANLKDLDKFHAKLSLKKRAEMFVQQYWDLARSSAFLCTQEVRIAARTDPQLRKALAPLAQEELQKTTLAAVFSDHGDPKVLAPLGNIVWGALVSLAFDSKVLENDAAYNKTITYLQKLVVRELSN